GSNAALAVAFSAALSSLMPMAGLTQKIVAVVMIVLLTVVNVYGVKLGSMVQNVFMVLKMLPIFAILIAGLLFGKETPNLSLMPASSPSIGKILGMVAFGVIATMWAYEGWTNLNTIAEEIKKPKKNLPLAIIISITGVAVLYVLFNYAIYRVLPYDTITAMIDGGDYYLGTAAAKTLFGSTGQIIVGSAMILAIFNSLNGCIMVFPRSYYAMARDGAFFKGMAKLHPTYKTPVNALVVSAAVSILLVLSRDLGQLTSLVAICGILFNGLTFFSVILLRKKYPTLERPYKVWGYPVLIILVCLVMVGLVINTFVEDPVTSLWGFLVPIIGLIVYEFGFKKSRENYLAQKEEEE
ncbi:MAG: amino acid permease, partial [Pygmaiobacter sp.]|nr:amino acid permease [Pygmaiobacter sp.]